MMISKFTEEMFLPLYKQGMSDQKIALRKDVSQFTVSRLRRSLSLPLVGSARSFVPANQENLYKWRCRLIDLAYAAGVQKAKARMEKEEINQCRSPAPQHR